MKTNEEGKLTKTSDAQIKQGTWGLLKGYFLHYSTGGILFILLAIIIDLQIPEPKTLYISIIINLLSSIGLAVLIASIFTFASGTSEFIEKIKTLLKEIIVTRDFLENIDPEGKKEALKYLIQPSTAEKNKYPNIGDYYGHFIEKTMSIGSRSVRSNYQVNSRAYFDETKNKIAIEGIYSYRLYPNSEGFSEVRVGFEEPQCGPSFCSYITISTPDGSRHHHPREILNFEEVDNGGDISNQAIVDLKSLGKNHNHLDIELKVTEYGSDHWSLITFKALQPTDGFKFNLHCEKPLTIKKHAIFVVGANYHISNENDSSINISCNQWINEGSGLSVLISAPHEISAELEKPDGDSENVVHLPPASQTNISLKKNQLS